MAGIRCNGRRAGAVTARTLTGAAMADIKQIHACPLEQFQGFRRAPFAYASGLRIMAYSRS